MAKIRQFKTHRLSPLIDRLWGSQPVAATISVRHAPPSRQRSSRTWPCLVTRAGKPEPCSLPAVAPALMPPSSATSGGRAMRRFFIVLVIWAFLPVGTSTMPLPPPGAPPISRSGQAAGYASRISCPHQCSKPWRSPMGRARERHFMKTDRNGTFRKPVAPSCPSFTKPGITEVNDGRRTGQSPSGFQPSQPAFRPSKRCTFFRSRVVIVLLASVSAPLPSPPPRDVIVKT